MSSEELATEICKLLFLNDNPNRTLPLTSFLESDVIQMSTAEWIAALSYLNEHNLAYCDSKSFYHLTLEGYWIGFLLIKEIPLEKQ